MARYVEVYRPGHPRARNGNVHEHILVVEKALGHYLSPPACVHHINENKKDNANTNLVVLQDNGEHSRLHRRLRVLRAGGNPWTQHLCFVCKKPKDTTEFTFDKKGCEGRRSDCKSCDAQRKRLSRAKNLTNG